MALERTYIIPLRKEIIKVAHYQKANKVVNGIVAFTSRHMKQPDKNKILIGQSLNLHIWKHGIGNPPPRVKVNMTKDDNGIVKVELFGAKPAKKETKRVEGKAEVAEEPKTEAKAEHKEHAHPEHADHKPAEHKAEHKTAEGEHKAKKAPKKAKKE